MSEFVQFTVTGVTIGAIYALLSLGWTMVMQVSGLLFFLQGEFVTLGAMTAIVLQDDGWPLAVVLLVPLVVGPVIAVGLDVMVIRQLRNPTHLSEITVLAGLSLVMERLLRMWVGSDPRGLDPYLPRTPLHFFGASILPHQLLAIGVTGALVVALVALLSRTNLGRAMRACAENPVGARLVGVSPEAMRTAGFAIAAVLGVAAGLLLSPFLAIAPESGLAFSLKGFIVALFCRWSLPWAIPAGITVGLAESYGAAYLSSAYKDVVSLSLLLVLLLAQTLRASDGPRSWRRRWRIAGGAAEA
jgi:branched-chain amino acid transport system permease protein